MGIVKDLVGQKFGKLTVVSFVEVKNGKSHWLCVCDCNGTNTKVINARSLHLKSAKSCGCLLKENHGGSVRQENVVELQDSHGILKTTKRDETTSYFLFDLEDVEIIKLHKWYENQYGYLEARIFKTDNPDLKHKTIRYHRLIMKMWGKDKQHISVDHINGNTKDNRKYNLRIITNQNNTFNAKLSVGNTSGHKGISWDKRVQKYQAYIMVDYKKINLGYYIDINEAIKVRQEAELRYFGNYSSLNREKAIAENKLKIDTINPNT